MVRRKKKAQASEKDTGAVVVEIREAPRGRLRFYAYLEILEARTAAASAIACGAERSGVLAKKRGKWSIVAATEQPDVRTLEPREGAGRYGKRQRRSEPSTASGAETTRGRDAKQPQ